MSIINNFRIFDVSNDCWLTRKDNKVLYEDIDRLIILKRNHKGAYVKVHNSIKKVVGTYNKFDLTDQRLAKAEVKAERKNKAMLMNDDGSADIQHKSLVFDMSDESDEPKDNTATKLQTKSLSFDMDDDTDDTDDESDDIVIDDKWKKIQANVKKIKTLIMNDDDDEIDDIDDDDEPVVPKEKAEFSDKYSKYPHAIELMKLKKRFSRDVSLKQIKPEKFIRKKNAYGKVIEETLLLPVCCTTKIQLAESYAIYCRKNAIRMSHLTYRIKALDNDVLHIVRAEKPVALNKN